MNEMDFMQPMIPVKNLIKLYGLKNKKKFSFFQEKVGGGGR